MHENIESNGLWFLPNSEDNKIYGKISYSQEQGIILETLGSFAEIEKIFSDANYPIILGVLQNGNKVTLINNAIASRTVNFPGIPSVKYISLYMLIGQHFHDKENINFHKISVEYHNLNKWINFSGLNKTQWSNKELSLHYSLPSEINFKVNNYVGSLAFSASRNDDNFSIFSLTEKVEFKLVSQNETSIFDIIRDSLIFQGFLTFATLESSYPNKILLRNNNDFETCNSNKIYQEVKLFYKSKISKSKKQKHSFEFLFTYQDVKNNFQNIIDKWYNYDQEIQPIIYLFLNSFYNHDTVFSENKFLEIIHALETFHRRTHKNYVISKIEYRKQTKTIIDSIPQEYRDWLQAKLNFGNEPSLHDRLVELLSEIKEFNILHEIISDNCQFIKDVKNSRNYYTHYDESLEKKYLKGSELYYLTMKLRIVLIIHLLISLGFGNEKINQILQRLKNHHYNFLFR